MPDGTQKPVVDREDTLPTAVEYVRAHLRDSLDDLINRHHEFWDGSLGTIKATEHRMKLKPGAMPERLQP